MLGALFLLLALRQWRSRPAPVLAANSLRSMQATSAAGRWPASDPYQKLSAGVRVRQAQKMKTRLTEEIGGPPHDGGTRQVERRTAARALANESRKLVADFTRRGKVRNVRKCRTRETLPQVDPQSAYAFWRLAAPASPSPGENQSPG